MAGSFVVSTTVLLIGMMVSMVMRTTAMAMAVIMRFVFLGMRGGGRFGTGSGSGTFWCLILCGLWFGARAGRAAAIFPFPGRHQELR